MFFFLYIGIGKFICKDASPPRRESPLHKKEESLNFPLLSHWADSNRRPTHYECVALPTEPQWQHYSLERETGCKITAFF